MCARLVCTSQCRQQQSATASIGRALPRMMCDGRKRVQAVNDFLAAHAVIMWCRSLRFEDKPDYSFLRRMFRDLFAKEGE